MYNTPRTPLSDVPLRGLNFNGTPSMPPLKTERKSSLLSSDTLSRGLGRQSNLDSGPSFQWGGGNQGDNVPFDSGHCHSEGLGPLIYRGIDAR